MLCTICYLLSTISYMVCTHLDNSETASPASPPFQKPRPPQTLEVFGARPRLRLTRPRLCWTKLPPPMTTLAIIFVASGCKALHRNCGEPTLHQKRLQQFKVYHSPLYLDSHAFICGLKKAQDSLCSTNRRAWHVDSSWCRRAEFQLHGGRPERHLDAHVTTGDVTDSRDAFSDRP